jgi:uncharacterized protein
MILEMDFIVLAVGLFFLIALLYSSVGHAGASGYLAIMALLSFPPETIKPTSILLNIVVASIASYQFIKKDFFNFRIFLSFVLTSIPAAFIGGYLSLPSHYFKLFAGIFLILSTIALLISAKWSKQNYPLRIIKPYQPILIGAFIGFVSGIIGVGGGIFLSPVLILSRWATVKQASGIAALFILVNSVAGLTGHLSAVKTIDTSILYWIMAVIVGGVIGTNLGTRKFNNSLIIYILALVLVSAGLKFILVDFMKQ